MTDATDLAELWMETTYHATFPRPKTRLRFTGAPVIVTAPRPSCWERMEVRIRVGLREMRPDSRTVIEGVGVAFLSASSGSHLYYAIDAVRGRHDFEEAVSKIAELAQK